MMSDAALAEITGGTQKQFSFDIEHDDVQNGSGNKIFDRALAHTLLKITEQFGVLPGFAFFNDTSSRNAFASPSRRLGRGDGSVVFGKILFDELMNRPQHPELGVASICAHEFGHIAQYKHGADKELVGGPDRKVKRLELHADFLAGYFAGNRKLEMPSFPAAVFAQTQFNFGDNSFGDPDHHGTREERGDAVVAGFEAAYQDRLQFMPAFERGLKYVQSISM
jgi:hypothetical protein